jgi:hypothetical protein
MKPTPSIASARWLSRYDRPNRGDDLFPRVNFEFQPRRSGNFFGGGDSPSRRPGFTSLAKEVLRADASRSFRLESIVLGVVTLVSLWPIAVMVHEVIRLLKSAGSF